MPELPEVETIKRSLEKQLVGYKITSLLKFRDSLRYKLDQNIEQKTIGAYIIKARRVAKYLIFDLNNHNSLIFHFGMTGRLTLRNKEYVFQKHDHVVFLLENETKNMHQLVFNDSRRFGMVYISPTSELLSQKYFSLLGAEPFSDDFNYLYLKRRFKNRKLPIKLAIMDNKILVGVGNIYASESLFLSKINPLAIAQNLTEKELNSLLQAIVYVLDKAIDAGGTSLRDFVNGDNKPGYFKQELNVYDRQGLKCHHCQTLIVKIKQSGRATYFCPSCQPL